MTASPKRRSTATTCVSVGYQGRSVAALCSELKAQNVRLLLDVRQAAWSQRPEFRKQALAAALAEHGVSYLHLREAGNPFRPAKGEQTSVAECATIYRRHIAQLPNVVTQVADVLRAQTTAVFCFEAEHECCHRSVLLDEVAKEVRLKVTRLGAASPRPKRARDPKGRGSLA